MDPNGIADSLRDAGFTQYEASVYLTLVRNGPTSAIEVASQSGVPKSRVYDVLRELETKGLVETYEQDSLRARALDPHDVIEDLRTRATSFAETADELEDLWEEPTLDEHDVTLVKRLETVVDHAKQFVRSAENEVQLAVTPEQFDELRPVLHEAFGRGVFVKLSLYPATDGTAPIDEEFDFEDVASEVVYRELPAPFVVLADRSKTCFSPQPGTGYQFGIVADNRPLTYVFHWYYQTSLWQAWERIYTTRGTEPPITYVNIRQCVVDIAPLFHEGAVISISADCVDTETGDERRISGRIVDLRYTGSAADNTYPSLSEVAGEVSIFVDTGTEIESIGGWYARIEDLELRRLTVETIEFEE